MDKFLKEIKEYGGLGSMIVVTIVGAAIAYGSATATASSIMSDHEKRLSSVEAQEKETNDMVIRIDQKVTDLWKDNGHKE